MSLKIINTGDNGGLTIKNTGGVGSFTLIQNTTTTPIDSEPTASYSTGSLVLNLDAYEYAGSGNWLDLTNNSNDAILVQTPTFSTNESGSFDLNGGSITATGQVDSFSISDNSTLDEMTAISIEMWIKIDTIQGVGSPNMLFSKRALNTNGYVAFFTNSSYTFRIGTSSPTQLSWVTSPTTDSWQQIVITVGSSGSKVYRNGIEVQNSPTYVGNFGNINTVANLVIGDINPNNTGIFGFDGKISIFRMYNKILSPTEVQQNFDAIKNRYGI